jgi:hypothetical protein
MLCLKKKNGVDVIPDVIDVHRLRQRHFVTMVSPCPEEYRNISVFHFVDDFYVSEALYQRLFKDMEERRGPYTEEDENELTDYDENQMWGGDDDDDDDDDDDEVVVVKPAVDYDSDCFIVDY